MQPRQSVASIRTYEAGEEVAPVPPEIDDPGELKTSSQDLRSEKFLSSNFPEHSARKWHHSGTSTKKTGVRRCRRTPVLTYGGPWVTRTLDLPLQRTLLFPLRSG